MHECTHACIPRRPTRKRFRFAKVPLDQGDCSDRSDGAFNICVDKRPSGPRISLLPSAELATRVADISFGISWRARAYACAYVRERLRVRVRICECACVLLRRWCC